MGDVFAKNAGLLLSQVPPLLLQNYQILEVEPQTNILSTKLLVSLEIGVSD
jgi:hypothetical protein